MTVLMVSVGGYTDSWVAQEYIPVAAPVEGERKASVVQWGYSGPSERWDYMGRPKATVSRQAKHLIPILEVMMSWATKPDHWFGEVRRPMRRTMQRAVDLLAANHFIAPLPMVRPTAGGGVQFEWGDDDHSIEIEVLENGTVVLMEQNGDELHTDETGDLLAPAVQSLLERIQAA